MLSDLQLEFGMAEDLSLADRYAEVFDNDLQALSTDRRFVRWGCSLP